MEKEQEVDVRLRGAELKKHVATIHCSNKLSLLQRKISNVLLYNAYSELLTKNEHRIGIKHLCELLGYNSNDYAKIKEALKVLISTVVEWNLLDEFSGEEDWTASSILADVRIKGAVCTYSYSVRMRELLHMPRMYGRINLYVQSRFRSSYGLALYENSIRYRGVPQTKWFSIEEFRKIMGVPDGKYKEFCDFKKRVLDKAINEVNTCSGLFVSAEIRRAGRKASNIRFKIVERPKKKKLGDKSAERNNDYPSEQRLLMEKIQRDFQISNQQLKRIFNDYSAEYIFEKAMLIKNSKGFAKGAIHNLAGYLLSALKGDYQTNHPSSNVMQQKRAEAATKIEKNIEKDRELSILRKEYSQYVNEFIDNVLSRLDAEEYEALTEQFTLGLVNTRNSFALDLYNKSKLNNKMVRALFNIYIKDRHKDLIDGMKSYHDFTLLTKRKAE